LDPTQAGTSPKQQPYDFGTTSRRGVHRMVKSY
jgi:hypothetical protein